MSLFDRLLGRGRASVTIPMMDGPFLPNQKLETAAVAATLPEADNLVLHAGVLHASSGADLVTIGAGGEIGLVETFKGSISALASREEALAIGVDGGGVEIRGGAFGGTSLAAHDQSLRCATALAWLGERELVVCIGSAIARPHEWRRSLMQVDASGEILKIDLARHSVSKLAGGLAWPAGLALADDRLFVAESWRHRVVALQASGGPATPVLHGLPGYPARLAPGARGGYWVSFYSVRNQLVEFILQEPRYRQRMIAEIPEAYWMAPSLSSGHDFKEPMQGGQLKQMGVLKPYSAGRSYGLVAYCDDALTPVGSFHSRADGRRHGTVSCVETDDGLLVASKGSDAVVRIPTPAIALSE